MQSLEHNEILFDEILSENYSGLLDSMGIKTMPPLKVGVLNVVVKFTAHWACKF